MDNERVPSLMKKIFGIFMILVYLGMGVLMFSDYFFWMPEWTKITLGVVLLFYGVWRGIREFKK